MHPRHGVLIGLGLLVSAICGCSPTNAFTPALPVGWKTVTHRGVAIDVPRSWTVEPYRSNCGVVQPTVFIGPERVTGIFNCPEFNATGAEVLLGASAVVQKSATTENLNGLTIRVTTHYEVYHGTLGATITFIYATLPTKAMTVYIAVGDSSRVAGGAPGRAEEILDSIHASPGTR